MSKLSIKDLYSHINAKNIKRLELYDKILQCCHKRIKYQSSLEKTYCFFHIPEFIIGTPLYSVIELRTYIINSLNKDGFKLVYVEPNWLFILWDTSGAKSLVSSSIELKNLKKEKKEEGKYKSVENVNKIGEIYNSSELMGFAEKLK